MHDELLSFEDMQRIRVEWRAEAEDCVHAALGVVARMQRRSPDAALMKELMRTLHSLKGTAAMVGFRDVAAFVHQLEDYCELFRGPEAVALRHLSLDLIATSMDELQSIVTSTEADRDPQVPGDSGAATLRATADLKKAHEPAPESRDTAPPPSPQGMTMKTPQRRCHPTTEEWEQKLAHFRSLTIEPCILLADVDPALSQQVGDLIKVILPRARLIEVDSGSKALNLMTSVLGDQIDLLLVSLDFTDMNGLAVLRSLHQLKSRGEIFASGLIMTAREPSEPERREALRWGVCEFLLKPPLLEELLLGLMAPIREAMMSRLLVSIVSYSQRIYLAFNRLQREGDAQLQSGIRREIHDMLTLMAKAQRSLQDTQMLPHA